MKIFEMNKKSGRRKSQGIYLQNYSYSTWYYSDISKLGTNSKKVMRKHWTGTAAIRRQIPLLKPKWEIIKNHK